MLVVNGVSYSSSRLPKQTILCSLVTLVVKKENLNIKQYIKKCFVLLNPKQTTRHPLFCVMKISEDNIAGPPVTHCY